MDEECHSRTFPPSSTLQVITFVLTSGVSQKHGHHIVPLGSKSSRLRFIRPNNVLYRGYSGKASGIDQIESVDSSCHFTGHIANRRKSFLGNVMTGWTMRAHEAACWGGTALAPPTTTEAKCPWPIDPNTISLVVSLFGF